MSSSGIFNLNADITGQNLNVIINSSIAYLNVGTNITATQVTVQAQSVYANGNINAVSTTTLGAAIQLLAQAIYVSGSLNVSTTNSTPNSNTNTSVTYNGNVIRKEDLPAFLIAQNNTTTALDQVYSSTAANDSMGALLNTQSNVITLTAANQLTLYSSAQVLANGTTGVAGGGYITISAQQFNAQSGSLIQANGNNGPGGTIAVSANDVIFAGSASASGTAGGSFAISANTISLNSQAAVQTNGSTGPGGTISLN